MQILLLLYLKTVEKIPCFKKQVFLKKLLYPLEQVTINNGSLSLTALDYGAIIQQLIVHDSSGNPVNVVVGFSSPESYLQDTISLGAAVGRYAGRISNGGFILDSKRYEIYNEDGVHLHGGKNGFSKKYWDILETSVNGNPSVELRYISPHMEEGYPGELQVKINYTLNGNCLQIVHEAITDRPTVLNLTNHSYFRLDDNENINDYHLQLSSHKYLETDDSLLPTGKYVDVDGGEFDFRQGKKITDLRLDTPFVLDKSEELFAEIYSEKSGVRMRVSTNQPAVVIYTPIGFPAICFETQNLPDAPNFNHFPSCVLRPGELYRNTASFEFDLVN